MGKTSMPKGRRHGAERLLAVPATHSGSGSGSCHPGGGFADLPDLSEHDVWPAFLAAAPHNSPYAADDDDDDAEGRDPGRRSSRASARRWVHRHMGGLSLAFEDACRGSAAAAQPPPRELQRVASSAPVDVPAWPRSLRSGSGEPSPQREEEEEEGEEADGEWLPPHEYLARAQGRSMATSVLEGVGRTLKGRDMSRVRDAVWSQTGFFG